MVRENHKSKITDGVSMEKAKSMGAMALFGEKYGNTVRVVEFGKSVELCGGTHVESTGSIGMVKIVSEAAIAAGIRRIEAVTAAKAEEFINEKLKTLNEIASLLKSTGNVTESVERLISENNSLKKSVEKFQIQATTSMMKDLVDNAITINNISFVSGRIEAGSADMLKNIAWQIRSSADSMVLVIGSESGGKANLLVMISDNLVKEKNLNAVAIIKEISGEINGGGGGQPFLATAGGKNPSGIGSALRKAEDYLRNV
jgi:alanyl-tRNA synthetase